LTKNDTLTLSSEEGGDIKQIIVDQLILIFHQLNPKLKTKTHGSGTLVKQTKMVQS
jgi:hypothetical protein